MKTNLLGNDNRSTQTRWSLEVKGFSRVSIKTRAVIQRQLVLCRCNSECVFRHIDGRDPQNHDYTYTTTGTWWESWDAVITMLFAPAKEEKSTRTRLFMLSPRSICWRNVCSGFCGYSRSVLNMLVSNKVPATYTRFYPQKSVRKNVGFSCSVLWRRAQGSCQDTTTQHMNW